MTRDWLDHAACIGAPDAVFFGEGGATYALAKAICSGCPVRLACLADCLEAESDRSRNLRYGVYAGLTPDERARLGRAG